MNTSAIDASARDTVAAAWGFGPAARFAPLGSGLINQTLEVRDGVRRYVLQRLNTAVFRSPEQLMANCHRVCAHLGSERAAGRYAYAVPALVPTLGGAQALQLDDGSWWRVFDYLPGTRTCDTTDDPRMAHEAGRAFGAFANALATLEPGSIGEVIPAFHDPASRYAAYRNAVAADRVGRVAACAMECAAADAFVEIVEAWQRLVACGLPRRIVHNDCKLNNLLFDADGRAVGVIDLDTVMPGSPLFDFGDLVRTLVSPVGEDSTELHRIEVRPAMLGAVAQGYVEGCGAMLTPLERDHLVLGARLITGIMALRFLTDHLDGDRYFRTSRPQHNLERARNQLALFARLGEADGDLQNLMP